MSVAFLEPGLYIRITKESKEKKEREKRETERRGERKRE